MYAIRNKNNKEYLKINYDDYGNGIRYYNLVYAAHCIEINFYVTTTLGYIATVLKENGDNTCEHEPEFNVSVDTSQLEVVDLIKNEVVPMDVVFDGYDDKDIPENKNKLIFDDEIEIEES